MSFSSCASTPASAPGRASAKIWQDDPATGDLVYVPLEIRFPKTLDHLTRGTTKVYDNKGLDVSVGYDSPDLPLWLTFYVYLRSYYPQPDVTSHFQEVLGAIMKLSPGSKLVSTDRVTTHFGDTPAQGMLALVHYSKGPTPGKWGGYALLYSYGEYYLYTRVSFRGTDNEKALAVARSITENFLRELDLPSPETKT